MLDPDFPTPEDDREARSFVLRGVRNAVLLSLPLWALLIGTCSMAFGQNTTANAGAQSGSAAQAGAGAQSGSAAIVQQTFTGPSATRQDQSVTYGGRFQTDQSMTYQGGYRQDYRATIRNTPDAYAPSVTGGTNPCTNGVSGGGSVAGFGLALGGTWSDPNCERRNLSALLHNQGQHALAQEVLCETDAVRNARRRMGQPCAADIPPGTPVVTPAPVVAAPLREVIGGGTLPAARPAWCETATPAERRQYRSTCG